MAVSIRYKKTAGADIKLTNITDDSEKLKFLHRFFQNFNWQASAK